MPKEFEPRTETIMSGNFPESTQKIMNVKEIMTKEPACCLSKTNLQEVAHLMVENDCGAIPIVENFETKKLVGIITDRDVTCNTVAQGKKPLEMCASEIMTFPVVSLTPEASLDECCKVMEENKIRRLLVVDDESVCCDIVAQAEIARKAPESETAGLVKDVSKSYTA